MHALSRILFVASGQEFEQDVLEQAGVLADDAELFTIMDISAKGPRSGMVAANDEGVYAVANVPKVPVAKGSFVKIEPGRTLEDVIVASRSYDLVIKPAGKATGLLRHVAASEDRELIRAAACPVWIVRQPLPKQQRRVLAAIEMDMTVEDSKLARAVLAQAAAVARLQKAKLIVVNTWRIERELELRGRLNVTRLIGDTQDAQHKQLQALLRQMPEIGKVDARSVKGMAHAIVPELAAREHIHLVVTGSRNPRGMGRLFRANTTERLVGGVECSVLVINEAAAGRRTPEWIRTRPVLKSRRRGVAMARV